MEKKKKGEGGRRLTLKLQGETGRDNVRFPTYTKRGPRE